MNQPIKDKGKKRITNAPGGFGDMLQGADDEEVASEVVASSVAKMNPFVALQEMDNHDSDRQKMVDVGANLLKHLNSIRFGLINGELTKDNLLNLRNALDNSPMILLRFPELQKVIDDIKMRAEIEIAKFQMLK